MKIQLSDHFSTKKLVKFVIPSIIMIVFTSIYGVVDGFFISNFAGKTAFAGVNLTMPFIMILGTFGYMIGAGGSALVSKTLGEGDNDRANKIFSMLVWTVLIFGFSITAIAQITLKQVIILLGADASMLPYCMIYGRITLCSLTFFMLQNVFQALLVTAGKPNIGLGITISAGVANMVLDLLFVGIFKWGVVGAGVATVISETIGGLVPMIYLACKNTSNLKIVKPIFDLKALLKACANGSSELMSYMSLSLVNMLYNLQLMKFYGQNGVAAYGTIMYVNFVFVAAFIGYSIGTAPIISYNLGAKNNAELKNVYKKSLGIIAILSLLMVATAMLLSKPLATIYAGYDKELFNLTIFAFRLFSTSYLIIGFNIYASSFFTALNNGGISATISFLRTLLLQIVAIYALPAIFGFNTIWLSITTAEAITLIISILFLIKNKKRYGY